MGRKKQEIQSPVIEHYRDHVDFLQARFLFLKKTKGFTLQTVGDGMQVSAAYVNMMFRKKQSMALDVALKMGKVLKLSDRDLSFLSTLVNFSNTKEPRQKYEFMQKLAKRKGFREHFSFDTEKLAFWGAWQNLAIFELAETPGFKADGHWISNRLWPHITPSQATEALELLYFLGLLEKNNDGSIFRKEKIIQTPDEFQHETIQASHAQMADLARWAIEEVPSTLRQFGNVVSRTNKEGRERLFERFIEMRKELFKIALEVETEDGEEIIVALMQAFPLTKNEDKAEDEKG